MRAITPAGIILVAESHVRKYENWVKIAKSDSAMARRFNLEACSHYFAVWTSILKKGGEGLNAEETQEVHEAYDDGSYDDLFRQGLN